MAVGGELGLVPAVSPLRRKAKPKPNPLDGVELVICTSAFRPAPVSRMVEKGDRLALDHDVVRSNPSHFAVPLTALLDKEGETSA